MRQRRIPPGPPSGDPLIIAALRRTVPRFDV
jgi:hypothetical protein